MHCVRTLSLLLITLLVVAVHVVYATHNNTVVCECRCYCNVDLTPALEQLKRLNERLSEVASLLEQLVNISKHTLLEVKSTHSTVLRFSRSIAETPDVIARSVSRINLNVSNTVFTDNSSKLLMPQLSSYCPNIEAQLLVGIPELRCFAPSSWFGPNGWVTIVNVSVIGLLAAISLWSIIAEIMSGVEPVEAFIRCGGLLVKCCVAGIFLTLLPHIISTWNNLIYHVVNWGVLAAFESAWILMTVLTLVLLFMPVVPKIVPGLEDIPLSIFQAHIVFTLLLGLMLYIKLLLALLVQITLPIGIALQEVRIRALRNLGLAIESTFWGLLIGTLLGAVMTQLIGAMYVKASETLAQGVNNVLSGAANVFAGLGDVIKCGAFGWLFHCSLEDAIARLREAAAQYVQGLHMLTVQFPLLLTLAMLGTVTPLFTVALTLWKKVTPLQFLDVLIGTTTGVHFVAQAYERTVRRQVVKQVQEKLRQRET